MHLEYQFMSFPARHLVKTFLQCDLYNIYENFIITVTPVSAADIL